MTEQEVDDRAKHKSSNQNCRTENPQKSTLQKKNHSSINKSPTNNRVPHNKTRKHYRSA